MHPLTSKQKKGCALIGSVALMLIGGGCLYYAMYEMTHSIKASNDFAIIGFLTVLCVYGLWHYAITFVRDITVKADEDDE